MKQTYNIPSSIQKGIKANNESIESLKIISTSLKNIAEATLKLRKLAEQYSPDNNEKRISLKK